MDDDDGWPDALVTLYRGSYRPFTQVAYLLLGSRAEAEEVVQDAFLATRVHWARVRQPEAYVRRAVVNGANGVLRRRAIAERRVPDPPPPGAPDTLVELRDVLGSLPVRQRAALVLRYVQDLDDADIAAALGCRRATVRSLVARGLTTIRSEVDL